MSSYSQIAQEVQSNSDANAIDVVRRQKIKNLTQITGRPLVLYATDFTTQHTDKIRIAGGEFNIHLPDKDGFDEVTRNIKSDNLDILLHSPGGSAEATESIVALLRSRFSHIRFIIPSVAKSAATMLAMSGNQLLMDEVSELGPIDPQMFIREKEKMITAPAQAILDQFKRAQREIIRDSSVLPAWLPILREYAPALLEMCKNHLALSQELVSKWLEGYMFAGDNEAVAKAKKVAEYLNAHKQFKSHGRRIGLDDLEKLGVDVIDMRKFPELHEAVRSLYTSIMYTFANSGAYKMFENSNNEARFRLIQIRHIELPIELPAQTGKPAQKAPQAKSQTKKPGRR